MDEWTQSGADAADADGAAGVDWSGPEVSDPLDSLWTYDDGSLWDLGPAEFDADGDGVADSRISELDGGHVILTDTDGDGRVDRMTALDADGRAHVDDAARGPLPWRPTSAWSPTSLGRLE